MPYNAILKNLYEPKMDVILTISFKITGEIEYVCFASYFADEDVYWRFVKLIMFFHSFIAMEYAFALFIFTVNIAGLMQHDHLAGGSFTRWKRLFPRVT